MVKILLKKRLVLNLEMVYNGYINEWCKDKIRGGKPR